MRLARPGTDGGSPDALAVTWFAMPKCAPSPVNEDSNLREYCMNLARSVYASRFRMLDALVVVLQHMAGARLSAFLASEAVSFGSARAMTEDSEGH